MASTGEGLVVVAPDGLVSLFNEAAEGMFGVKRSEVVGHGVEALGHKPLSAAVERAASGAPRCEVRPVVLEAAGKVLACKVVPFSARGGRALAIVVRDDSELVEQQERAEAVLAGAGDGLVVFAPDGRVTYVNPAAREMLGKRVKDAVGRQATIDELLGLPVRDLSEMDPCWEVRRCGRLDCPAYGAEDLRCWLRCGTPGADGQSLSFRDKRDLCVACEVRLAGSAILGEGDGPREVVIEDPGRRVLVLRTNPVIDRCGRYLGCVTSLHDITAERDVALMKNEFVSTVSHELRTPLTSIKGYVDLILDGEAGEINEIQREFLSIVQENSDRLVSLINDLLDISRIESGRIHLKVEPIDPDDMLRGVAETFRAVAERSGIEIGIKVARGIPRAAGDRDRVGQVLLNLASNAIKYSPEGGQVTLSARRKANEIVFAVADTGIGIPKEDQPRLFEKFYRVDSSLTREIGGTGLGLSICKTIVELLGGRIWARSEAGRGSTFSFALPVAPAELVRTPGVEGPLDASGSKVLVVDHDPEIAALVETFLRKRGYEVIVAHEARDVVELAAAESPRLITLDVLLDDMDGFDLLQRLKDDPRTAEIPVVVLSIVCDEGRSLRLGAADYLEKPIDQERLTRVIADLLGGLATPLVLVVDDDRDTVDALCRMLRARGMATAAAYDGREAMAAIEHRRPDLVLLDLKMPVMDGYQVIQEVKSREATRDIPIVIMTAHRIARDKTDLIGMTAGQLSKPFMPDELAERVQSILVGEE